MLSGSVFNIQKYTVHDGPGIRTTIFLKGCPLDCLWCHNPEGKAAQSEIGFVEGRCVACGSCFEACPFGAEPGQRKSLPAANPLCIACGACVEACPAGARQVFGRQMTVAEVMKEIINDRVFYEESGGGVTFSGGEPLSQHLFLEALLKGCRTEEITTAVDTCGHTRWEYMESIARLTHLFLYDVKLIDEDLHRQVTGVSNTLILDNLMKLGKIHSNIWLRVPIIPGVNDIAGRLEEIADFAASVPGIRQVNLLAYHAMGRNKSERLGKPAVGMEAAQPSLEKMEACAAKFRARGLVTITGG